VVMEVCFVLFVSGLGFLWGVCRKQLGWLMGWTYARLMHGA